MSKLATDEEASDLAWEYLQSEFPRLLNYEGAKP